MKPIVTVLMPVYNGETFLKEAIDSILNQTFTDFEFLIINDGSTDKSEEIILDYNDSRIRYIKNDENLKLIKTLNKGINLAKAEFLVRMDADDISFPNRIERQVNFMRNNIDVVVAGSWFQCVGNNSNIIQYSTQHNAIVTEFLYKCSICHPSTIWRLENLDTLKFNTDFDHAEDYEFWIQCMNKGKLANIPEVLLKYRTHDMNVSSQYSEIQINNSSLIRKNLFLKIGIEISSEELESFKALCYSNWQYFDKLEKIKELSALLSNLIHANKKSGIIEQNYLQEFLGLKWFHINYNCGSWSLLRSNQLINSISWVKRIKFLIKLKLS
jgi:glycosyltransferase involved in cell wall biosynthesis